jgi:hypothetical protein
MKRGSRPVSGMTTGSPLSTVYRQNESSSGTDAGITSVLFAWYSRSPSTSETTASSTPNDFCA